VIWTLSQCEQQLMKDQRERDELRLKVERLRTALEEMTRYGHVDASWYEAAARRALEAADNA
jgi:hypothetical protein